MKKIFALLLTLTLFMSMFSVVSMASESTAVYPSTMYIDDDFEGYSVGTASALSSSATGTTAAVNATIVYDEEKGGNVLQATSSGRYTVRFANGVCAKSKVAVEFDFKATSSAAVTSPTYFIALEGASGSEAGRVWWLIKDGTVLRAPGISAVTSTTESFADTWYSAKVVYDITTGETNWYAAKLGEELEHKGTHTRVLDAADQVNIGRINIQNSSGFYIDNLQVYEVVDDSEAKALISKAKAAIAATEVISPAPITYLQSDIDTLNSAIASAESALENAATASDIETLTADIRAAYQTFLSKGMDKQNQVEIFKANFGETDNLSEYQVLYTDGDSSVEKVTAGDREAIKLTGGADAYARFIKDVSSVAYDRYVMKSSFRQDSKTAVNQITTVFSSNFNEVNNVFEIYSDGTNICIRYSDNAIGYSSNSLQKSAVLVSNYSANVWYDMEVAFDYTDRTFTVLVNGSPVLTDRALYFAGSSSLQETKMRAAVYANPAQSLYISDFALYADESASIVGAYQTIDAAIPYGTGAEYYRELPKTVGSYSVTYESEDFQIADDSAMSSEYIAYTTYGTEATTGDITAKITVDGTEYSFTYTLPIAAAYSGNVIDHNYDVTAGTAASTIDSAYWTAVGAIASVTEVEGREGGVLSFNGQRTLYTVPADKRIADIAVVELDVMTPELIKSRSGHIISISGESGKGAVDICFGDEDICVIPGDYFDSEEFPGQYASARVPIVEDYEAGKWYNIKVLLNFTTRSYKVLVDGATTLNNRTIKISDPVRNIGRLSIQASEGDQMYIDNLKVYSDGFASISGKDALTIKADEMNTVTEEIFPSSYNADGDMVADRYTFEIEGTDTTGITVAKTGLINVAPTAKTGTYTVTATSAYDTSKSVTTTVTVVSADYVVSEFSIKADGAAVEALTPGMTLNVKAVISKNSATPLSNGVALLVAQYDATGKLVKVTKNDVDFTEIGLGAATNLECDLAVEGDDVTDHTARAFLVYKDKFYPVTESKSAF